MDQVDYADLLKKYMAWVEYCEGTFFLKNEDATFMPFTQQEWDELRRISRHIDKVEA